jgi:hypothetical protein
MEPTDAPVVAEKYDEVVFTDPIEPFFEQLQQVTKAPSVEYSHQAHFPKYSDADNFLALLEAKKFLAKELERIKERQDLVNSDLEKADVELREAQEKASAAAAAASSQRKSNNASKKAARTAPPAAKKAKTSASVTTTAT